MLGHVFLYVFLNYFLPYATINLFTAALWLGAVLFLIIIGHILWLTKCISCLKHSIYVFLYGGGGHSQFKQGISLLYLYMMKTYKIKLEDKAAFLNRLEKVRC